MMLLPLRVAMSSRTRPAMGSGMTAGEEPRLIVSTAPSSWTSSTVSWLMVAMRWAKSTSSPRP
jgi:hypothetical protein